MDYRLYFLNEGGSFWRVVEIEAADDAAALDQARRHLSQWRLELWQGARMVAQLSPEGG